MISIKIERRKEATPWWVNLTVPILAVVVSFAITAPLVLASGANPLRAFYWMAIAPFTTRFSFLEILVEALPLIFTGLAVTIAFKAKYWNIGAEGQLYAGAVGAAWAGVVLGKLPTPLLLPIILVLGFTAGALWSLVCRLLRTKIDEAISTLLLNWVMLYLVGALLGGPWLNPITKWPQSPEIAEAAHLPTLIHGSRINLGLPITLTLVIATHWILNKTALGFEIQAIGTNPRAARLVGVDKARIITIIALISGGLAGLAGVTEVCGKHFHLIEELSPGYGYTGIVVATMGGLNPWGSLLAALFLGALNIGGQIMHSTTQTPVPLAKVVQGVMLLATVTLLQIPKYRIALMRGGKR